MDAEEERRRLRFLDRWRLRLASRLTRWTADARCRRAMRVLEASLELRATASELRATARRLRAEASRLRQERRGD